MPDELTILTVDDEPLVRQTLVHLLEREGLRPVQARDGAEALATFAAVRPDAVLLDLRMPGIDGLDVLTELVRRAPHIPVIVVSGQGTVTDAIEALRRGAWDFVMKPIFESAVLAHVIGKTLEKARLLRENQEYRQQLETSNARLSAALGELRDDQDAAKLLQFQLLPPDDSRIGAYTFCRRLFPSRLLSGDFIDYFALGARHVGFYLADVAGHGAASAFVTAMLATLVGKYREMFATDRDATILDPERLLSAIDRHLCGIDIDRHVTMFYGVLDLERHVLDYANASLYPYPLLLTAEGARYLDCPGRPLGLFAGGLHRRAQLPLPAEGAMMLFSDGVLDKLAGDTLADKKAHLATAAGEARDLPRLLAQLGLGEADDNPDDIAILTLTWAADRSVKEAPHGR